ncbi:major facilitator superfamily transporter [Colletotrichum graminicola]|uniref:Major facilitator superfamily transporter n=1 Tax=Colletotrichum graminicola (strain M1.001 / M2 / FGSC 10212) TaxID=645133 RepID=E3QSQ5_COLGM|nr:major facilitator superfamily transporter [Colletotrichum graminicola M1.001]EFQ33893.1 major facilitator superfamily transporter [Colletotrichum graminicola M1.001]WDK19507.1 major facilitator superfamily transporter [Colletotrichum graminicola]
MDNLSPKSSHTLPPGSPSHPDSAPTGRRYAPITTTVTRPVATKEQMDPELDVNLPYRTLSANANLDEYRVETSAGEIPVTGPSAAAGGNYKLVTFVPNDPDNPKNWSKAYKWYCTMVVAMTCFVVAFCSSVITADIAGVAEEFHISEEAALLSITVFVIGFGVGPMAFAPLSEIFGRQIIYASTLLVAVVFIIPCALAKNLATLLVCRAIDGIAFSAPMTLVGGTLADLWRNEERGVPMAAFSAAPFIGPAIGPLVGGFLSDATNWRWLYWIQLILSFVVWVLISFTVRETYAPTILARRAKKMRKETGDPSHVTEQDIDMRPLSERLGIFLIRPFQLLFRELIVFLISIYMSVLYGLLYMFFVAFPIIYQKRKGYSASTTGLMFIPLAVGVLCSAACSPWVNKHYLKLVAKHNGHPPAETRLIPMMVSCWCIPIGLFIFAWTSLPHLHWAGPALGGFPVGFGFIFLYNSANNYLVDSYQHQAASALAAKTCIRSFWGAAVVLFTEQMYDRLGDQWASTLLAFIGLACCAIPFLFWVYGARIRARSKYAYSSDDEETSGSDVEKAKPQNVLSPTRTFEPA